MVIYTNDCQVVGKEDSELKYIETAFDEKFGVQSTSSSDLLGMEREIKDGSIDIRQTAYIEKVHQNFCSLMPDN